MATRDQVIAALRHLVAGFPQAKLTSEAVDAYIEDLADVDGLALQRAVEQMRRSWKWMPSIADIREVAAGIREQMHRAEKAHEIMRDDVDREPSPEAKKAVQDILRRLAGGMKMGE